MREQAVTPNDRPGTRNLGALRRLLGFTRPYGWQLAGALVALFVAAGSVLAFGQVIRTLVDSGLTSGSTQALDQALLLFLAVSCWRPASPSGCAAICSTGSASGWWRISARASSIGCCRSMSASSRRPASAR
jgi:ABC-type multidrug transport system fused ATPase/permease subunit